MAAIELDYRGLLRIVLAILAAHVVLAASHKPVWGAANHTFILPASNAYGVADCLGKAQGCSEVVASAWCEAHGYAAPVAYGRAADMTGSTPGAKPVKLDPDAFIVTCGE